MAKDTPSAPKAKKWHFETYDERLDGPNEDREIVAGDWRDPDVLLEMKNYGTVMVDGQIQLQDDAGRHIDIQGILKMAHRDGRRLEGIIIARDFSRHN